MDMSTKYLGLALPHPFMAGAGPMADSVDGAKRVEDAGASAIVMRSLFEEQLHKEELANEIRDQINVELERLRKENLIDFQAITPLMTVARRFERVSDQTKNICEEVLYLCTGEYAKHKSTEVCKVLFVDQDNSCLSQIAEAIVLSYDLEGTSNSAGPVPA